MSFAISASLPTDKGETRARLAALTLGVLLVLSIVGFEPLARPKTESLTGNGDLLRQLAYTLVAGFLLATQLPGTDFRRLLRLPLFIGLVLIWSMFSLLWAIEPAVAARRLGLTTLVIFSIFAAVASAGTEKTLTTLRVVLLGTLVLNYIAILTAPAALHQTGDLADLVGTWRGILGHKNFAGSACAFTVIVFAFGRGNVLARSAIAAAAAVFLINSHSKTSMALLVVALIASGVYALLPVKRRPLVVILAATVVAFVVAFDFFSADALPTSISDPYAFSGRMRIWTSVLGYIANHPFGAGFGSFWNIGPQSPIFGLAGDWVQQLGNGHSGYIDVLAQIGIPGLVLAILAAIILPLATLAGPSIESRQDGGMLVALIIFAAGHNLTETSLFDRDAQVWVIMLIAIALTFQMSRSGAPNAALAWRRLPKGSAK